MIKQQTMSATATEEKEDIRRKLAITARKLSLSHKTLEKKVLERTKDCEELRARYEAIIASIGDGLVATDTRGHVLLVNKAFEKLTGWKGKEAQGKRLSAVIPPAEEAGSYKRKDGTSFPAAITEAPIFMGKDLLGTVKIFRDITKEKEIDRAKSEFMSIASHQLRTPLTAIRWALSSLKREPLPEELSQLVKTAHETSTNMAVTIRRMLMISHVEEGGREPDLAAVDLRTVLDKVTRLHDAHRLRNGLTLTVRCPSDLRVRTDEQLLVEILDNLLSNAYKYTPTGGRVSVRAVPRGDKIRIAVADTGYGIPLAEQKRVPEKFFRASNIASPAEAGTGIGLYMVYNIVRLIGGTISFVSEENKGTTFTLVFPA